MRQRSLFVSLYGQQDNLGDSVLRRGLVHSMRHEGSQLHLFVGDNSDDYNSGLGIQPDDVVYRSRREWQRALVSAALRRRVVYLFNPGEAGGNGPYVSLGTLGLLVLVRLAGGQVHHTGIGLRNTQQGRRSRLGLAMRLSTVVSWRDPVSRDVAGVGEVRPDWAVLATPPQSWGELAGAARTDLTISMRGDRPYPSVDWFAAVAALAQSEGLAVRVLTQVRRDEDRAREIAAELGADLTLWTTTDDHAAWEQAVRERYRRSAAVISDRLHSLVIGLTEGAVPIGFTVGSPEKVQRTLSPLGLQSHCFSAEGIGSDAALDTMQGLVRSPESVHAQYLSAAGSLSELASELRRRIAA